MKHYPMLLLLTLLISSNAMLYAQKESYDSLQDDSYQLEEVNGNQLIIITYPI